MANPQPRLSPRPGFTLIELLVVITIVTVMITMLVPTLSKARNQAKQSLCLGNLRQHMAAVHTYAADYQNYLIPQMHRGNTSFHNWGLILSTYMGDTYGPLSNWNAVDVSNGATARRGTAFICPAEEYVGGVRIDIPSNVPQAAGAIGYGDGGSVILWKYYFTTYALNLYATRRRTVPSDTTQAVNYQTFNSGAGNDLRKLDSKRYPSDLWFISEGYPLSYQNVILAAALTRSKSYAKMNFDRHPNFSANIGYLDGHSANYVLDTNPGDVADPNDSPLNEVMVKSYKHWGTQDDSNTGW
jgi:prepilin-type N-terminal cleavage/methylation domain-containing protein/prepilin-type processing-associated H-X9-DG protein